MMNRKGPWEGHRRQAKRRLASRPLPPSRLPLRAHFHREKDVWVRSSNGDVFKMRKAKIRRAFFTSLFTERLNTMHQSVPWNLEQGTHAPDGLG